MTKVDGQLLFLIDFSKDGVAPQAALSIDGRPAD